MPFKGLFYKQCLWGKTARFPIKEGTIPWTISYEEVCDLLLASLNTTFNYFGISR